MTTCYEYLRMNEDKIKALYKAGFVSSSTITHFRFFKEFKALNKHKGKMQSYQEVADNNGVSISTVIKAIRNLSRTI